MVLTTLQPLFLNSAEVHGGLPKKKKNIFKINVSGFCSDFQFLLYPMGNWSISLMQLGTFLGFSFLIFLMKSCKKSKIIFITRIFRVFKFQTTEVYADLWCGFWNYFVIFVQISVRINNDVSAWIIQPMPHKLSSIKWSNHKSIFFKNMVFLTREK